MLKKNPISARRMASLLAVIGFVVCHMATATQSQAGEAQNFTVSFKNLTPIEFKLTHVGGKPIAASKDEDFSDLTKWGKITHKENIKSGSPTSGKTTMNAFRTSGADGAAAGTQGSATYSSTEDGETSFTMTWEVPYGFGDDTLKISTRGCDISPRRVSGDDLLRQNVILMIVPESN